MIYVFQAKQVGILEHYNTQMVPCSNSGRPKEDIDLKRAMLFLKHVCMRTGRIKR